ncbi:hypothetical protein LCGC14_0375820 [marine sediment metagenome]|uniref:Terminase small subunit n=1 Tax=marine sediment metagenome TaxID=412755 RepID=A0A0F9T9M1_9ZZZZ
MSKRPLTAKQTSFTEYYCNPGSDTYNNATQSAIKAGYSAGSADVRAAELVVNSRVITAMTEYKAKTTAKLDHNRDIAIAQLNQNIAWLTPKAKTGDTQAVQALTGAIRELDAISNLHKQTIVSEPVRPQATEAEQEQLRELARTYKIRLVNDLKHA